MSKFLRFFVVFMLIFSISALAYFYIQTSNLKSAILKSQKLALTKQTAYPKAVVDNNSELTETYDYINIPKIGVSLGYDKKLFDNPTISETAGRIRVTFGNSEKVDFYPYYSAQKYNSLLDWWNMTRPNKEDVYCDNDNQKPDNCRPYTSKEIETQIDSDIPDKCGFKAIRELKIGYTIPEDNRYRYKFFLIDNPTPFIFSFESEEWGGVADNNDCVFPFFKLKNNN